MPRRIEVNRVGPLAWVIVDGHEMWAEDVMVSIDPQTRPSITLTLTASEVVATNCTGESYGEAEEVRHQTQAG